MESFNKNTKFTANAVQEQIKIGDLSILAEVSKSTIHHYLKLGLLHPPEKMGPKKSIFNSSHLIRLNRIKELRQNDRLSLSKIKQLLSKESHVVQEATKIFDTAAMIRELEEKKKHTKAQKDDIKRNQIVDAAIALFAKIGYEKTTLEAIAESLRIAKSTVYLYFENKEQLFMKCIDRLAFIAVPEKDWDDISREKDLVLRLKKRAIAFHNVFPNYRGLLTMIKASLGSENPEISEKAKNALFMMTKPIKKDIRRAITAGVFKDLNEDIIAHLLLAMGEGLGFRMMLDSHFNDTEAVDIMFDFICNGILNDPCIQNPSSNIYHSTALLDNNGNKTIITDIRFGETNTLPVRIGEANVNLFLDKIKSLTFSEKDSFLTIRIKDLNGFETDAQTDNTHTVSGVVSFGKFEIALKHVQRIDFNLQE